MPKYPTIGPVNRRLDPSPAALPTIARPALWVWAKHFAALGESFYTPWGAVPLPQPYRVGLSGAMARELGLEEAWLASDDALNLLCGNAQFADYAPLSSVYSGHQFGVWAGQLGDGRALLLAEIDVNHAHWELQLKGAGHTPYSRMGDGRAVLRSSIREFLCSEAMYALGVPTTRALSVMGSDQPVRREQWESAAVVARLAPSFIRFGHFEHFAAKGDLVALRQLADYVIAHHYSDCQHPPPGQGNAYAALLRAVVARTAALIAQWQALGFCHGVMNTDNMSILGLTLDYGPFQFLDAYDPGHICNHSDGQGRYAFNQQPKVAYWNLFCLAQALMPLIEERDHALAALEPYKTEFAAAYQQRLGAKLGLSQTSAEDADLIERILTLLATERVDYTIFWQRLSKAVAAEGAANPGTGAPPSTPLPASTAVRDLFIDRAGFDVWHQGYQARLADLTRLNPSAHEAVAQTMRQANPQYVLRNYLAQEVIDAAKLKDFAPLQSLMQALAQPYQEQPGCERYAAFPPAWASTLEISCSS